MKITRRKHPDHLVDSCKRLSVNRMVAGSRPPRSSHRFFLLSPTFQTPSVAKVFEQAVGPGVLQTFSTCAVKHLAEKQDNLI